MASLCQWNTYCGTYNVACRRTRTREHTHTLTGESSLLCPQEHYQSKSNSVTTWYSSVCVCVYMFTHTCVCACVCMLVQYNGRPKGAERNRMSQNSKVFFSFYYHTIAEGRERERERSKDRWREETGEQLGKKRKMGKVISSSPSGCRRATLCPARSCVLVYLCTHSVGRRKCKHFVWK